VQAHAVRAVLFDFGGTLYDYGSLARAEAESLRKLAEWAEIDAPEEEVRRAQRNAMRRVYRHRDLFEDALRELLASFGTEARQEWLDGYRALQWAGHARDFELRPGAIETLSTLRARGLHLGMVSNIDEDQLEHLLDISGLRPYFDEILSSERAGSCKPDGAIFERALASAACAARETLFVGDSRQADIAGANARGLRSVLIWHRRDRTPPEEGPQPDHVIGSIPELLDLT
jgi:putative hydrolase of the HAD superfamily